MPDCWVPKLKDCGGATDERYRPMEQFAGRTRSPPRVPNASRCSKLRLQVRCSAEFYESDCQGQFLSLLIAFWFSPLQSAPSDLKKMNESA
jgi:hypothetical protein